MRRRDVNERVKRTDAEDSRDEREDAEPAPDVAVQRKRDGDDADDDPHGSIGLTNVLFHAVIVAYACADAGKTVLTIFKPEMDDCRMA